MSLVNVLGVQKQPTLQQRVPVFLGTLLPPAFEWRNQKGKNRQSQHFSWFKPEVYPKHRLLFLGKGCRDTWLWSSSGAAWAPSWLCCGSGLWGEQENTGKWGSGWRRDQPWTFRAQQWREEEEEECCCPDVRSCSWECFAFLFLAVVRWLPARRKEQPFPTRKKKKKGAGGIESARRKRTLYNKSIVGEALLLKARLGIGTRCSAFESCTNVKRVY